MSENEFVISGFELLEKEAKPHGNGARVLVPKSWSGEKVKVVRATKKGKSGENIEPIAALMHDALSEGDESLETALNKVVRFKSFSDVDEGIVQDFQVALNSYDAKQSLRNACEETDDSTVKEFYKDVCSSEPLRRVTKRWS